MNPTAVPSGRSIFDDVERLRFAQSNAYHGGIVVNRYTPDVNVARTPVEASPTDRIEFPNQSPRYRVARNKLLAPELQVQRATLPVVITGAVPFWESNAQNVELIRTS